MKKSYPVQLIVFILAGLTHMGFSQSVVGSHHVTESQRDVGSFNSISVSSGWDLYLEQGSKESLTVEADDNLHEVLITEVKGGTLHIYTRKGVNIKGSEKKEVHVVVTNLKEISASGGSDVKAIERIEVGDFVLKLSGGSDLEMDDFVVGGLSGDFSGGSDANIDMTGSGNISLNCSGGSDVNLSTVDGSTCKLILSGGSDVSLDGRMEELDVNASGGSDISAENLETMRATINLSGSSDGKFTVTEELNLSLSGGSDVIIRGDPRVVRQNVCKSCDVRL